MPNGDDRVRVQSPDGRTGTIPRSSLAKAQSKGWKIETQSTYEKLTAPDLTTQNPVLNFLSNVGGAAMAVPGAAYQTIRHPVDTARDMAGQVGEAAKFWTGQDPKLKPSVQGVMSVLPAALGIGAGTVAGGELLGGAISEAARAVAPKVRPVVRDVWGVGKRDVEPKVAKAVEKVKSENTKAADDYSEAVKEHQQKLQDIKDRNDKAKAEYNQAVQEAQRKNQKIDAAYRQRLQDAADKHAKAQADYQQALKDTQTKRDVAEQSRVRHETLVSKQGPMYERMNQMADDAQKHVTEIEKRAHDIGSAQWDSFTEDFGDAPVKTKTTADAIGKAQDELAGDNLPVLKQVLKEIAQDPSDHDVALQQFIDSLTEPEARERFIAESKAGQAEPTVPLKTARKLYTKLSAKLRSDLPPSVARVIGSVVLEPLDRSIAESVATKGGGDGLARYRQLQKDWKQYRQTFSDNDSPLRKIIDAKDPDTKRNPIVSEKGQRAIEYLNRYKHLGADTAKLEKLRAVDKMIKEFPSGSRWPETIKEPAKPKDVRLPEKPEMKKLPTKPEEIKAPAAPSAPQVKTAPTAEDVRREMLESRGQSFSGPPRRLEMLIPPLLLFRMMLKHITQNPRFIDYLSKETPPVP